MTGAVVRKWLGKNADEEAARQISDYFGIHPLVARILTTRNCSRIESAEEFLYPKKESLIDPFLMHDMGRAVDRIKRAIANGEHIVVFGDYDTDGTCATAIMMKTLRSMGAKVDYYIPDRVKEGYGINIKAVESFHDAGCHS